MDKDYLTLKRVSVSRPSGEWGENDYDVLADGVVVGRIVKAAASPADKPWMWTVLFGYHEDRIPTHGYAETREAAMGAFAKSCGGSRTTTAATLAFIVALAQQEKHHDASVGNCWSIRRDFGAGAHKR